MTPPPYLIQLILLPLRWMELYLYNVCVCLSEINRKLRAVTSLLSPEPQSVKAKRHVSVSPPDNDDIIIVSPELSGVQDSPYCSAVREIPLKIRCRTDVHKIPVLSVGHSETASDVDPAVGAVMSLMCLILLFAVDTFK